MNHRFKKGITYKFVVTFIIALSLFLVSISGCSKQTEIDSLSAFLDKYKREDILVLSEKTEEFIFDFICETNLIQNENVENGEWILDESSPSDWYEMKTVMFNFPVEIFTDRFQYRTENYLSISIDAGNTEIEKDLAINLCENLFDLYGDPESISLDYTEDSTENELRSLWVSGEDGSFSCAWEFDYKSFENVRISISRGYVELSKKDISTISISCSVPKE